MSAISVTSGGRERVKNATRLLSKAFEQDPIIMYMLSSMNKEDRLAYLPKYFSSLLTAAAMNHGRFDEADDWKACGVFMPPGCRVDNPWTILRAGFVPMLWKIGIGGCQPLSDALKEKALAGQKRYYYVFFVGTRMDSRGRGLCSTIMKNYQEIASREMLPIWLEATTEGSMNLYLKLGWEVVDVIVLGKGKARADGERCKDGAGVKIWGMIWRPNKIP